MLTPILAILLAISATLAAPTPSPARFVRSADDGNRISAGLSKRQNATAGGDGSGNLDLTVVKVSENYSLSGQLVVSFVTCIYQPCEYILRAVNDLSFLLRSAKSADIQFAALAEALESNFYTAALQRFAAQDFVAAGFIDGDAVVQQLT